MDKIVFEYNGVTYSMTKEEIEAAYDYRHQQDLLEDANRQLEMYAFGSAQDCLDEEHVESGLAEFQDQHGIPYDTVKDHCDRIVKRFEHLRREDVDDEMTWVIAIEAIISELASNDPTRFQE